MDLETTQNNAIAKLPLLKQGDYEMWKLRIEQYFQVQDYALWEVIEYGNSFKPVARTTTNADGTSTSTIPGPVTTEEKAHKKNDVKARSMLLMALPNEHQLTFSQYKDAKTLFEAIQARFGGNEATKKTQKTLLKQMYENFSASSQESLDSISNRLQKIVSQLAILGENISQEDLNFKFLRSLPSEWSMHVVNVAFVSTPGSTNEDITANIQDSIASIDVNTASTNNSTASLSDATVECFNCHKMGHFARECRGPMNQESSPRNQKSRHRNQESSKRTVNVEDTSSKAVVAFDGAGFDWSFMADEEVPTNLALMTFSDSKYDSLRVELNKSEFDLATYKRGLASVEEQFAFYKKNEIEKLKKEKESNQIKIDKFENASKSLDKLIGSQISNNNRKGMGYNDVPPPPIGLFAPPIIDLSSSGLKESQQPKFEGYGVNVSDCDEDECEEMVSDNVQHKSEPKPEQGDPQVALKDTWIFDSGCSRHMTRNKSYLTDYQDHDGG
ncbi:ribonuclease H-like domain-containing protein [Tanacetum coccineum]